jgi:hypothetical protein
LENLLKDEAVDGTPLDPDRDSELEYRRMSAIVERINRSMLTIYVEYLGANAVHMLQSQPSQSQRKRPAEAANMARYTKQCTLELPPASPPATVPERGTAPYSHAKDQPAPPLTTPQFDPIPPTETGNRALLNHVPCRATSSGILAIADTGASHILLRESDSSLLT